MTPTPPSTTSSIGSQPSPDGHFRVVRKRNRVPLSCGPCRNRKLKCNRSHPCDNCTKRQDVASCSYAAPEGRKRNNTHQSSSSSTPGDMQNRIDRLEGLVLSLMTNGAQSAGPAAAQRALSLSTSAGSLDYPLDVDGDDDSMVKEENGEVDSETDQMVKELGVLKVNNEKATYFGEAHWAAVLKDIAEVRNYFSEHSKQLDEHHRKVQESQDYVVNDFTQGLGFLFGGAKLPHMSDLLAALPGKKESDGLVTRFFNSDYGMSANILHPQTFQIIYNRHWEDPSKTGPAWLGQLFAIYCLALYSYNRGDDEPPEYQGKSLQIASKYRAFTAQSLLLADFTKPVSHMVETLILHIQGELARSKDAEVGIWVLIGMIVRLAMRMGYHRDPKYFSTITPFAGEMRRRVWNFVRQADIMFSFQISLPGMIRHGDCDTEIPRNVYDEELYEDMKDLPPSRPLLEATPVSYHIIKSQMAFVFGRVIETLQSVSSCPYEDIIALDNDLQRARGDLPPHLHIKPMEESMTDANSLVLQRFSLSVLYHKAQCVLHRKFLGRARVNQKYSHSRRTCVESAMTLLQHQATLHYESRPGRRLCSMKWFINSMTAHNFLLAAMIICLDIWYATEAECAAPGAGDMHTFGLEGIQEMLQALETSKSIWVELRDQSMEAYKASQILTVIMDGRNTKRAQRAAREAQRPMPYFTAEQSGINGYGLPGEEKPEHSAAITLGMLSSGGVTSNPNSPFGGFSGSGGNVDMGAMPGTGLTPNYSMEQPLESTDTGQSPFPFFGNGHSTMDTSPTNLDWDVWDSYIQNASLDASNQLWSTSMDIPGSTPAVEGQGDVQSRQQQQSTGFYLNGGIYMGNSSPPRNAAP